MKQFETMDLCAPIKQTKGRQKIEIKKIEKKSNRMVTFSKRRMGLFRKASELSILCGAEIAILVQSPASKIYSFGSSSVDSVLERFYGYELAPVDDDEIGKTTLHGKIVYLDAENRLEAEKGIVKSDFWWHRSDSEILKLDELEENLKALQGLESCVSKRVDELKIESLPALIDVDGDDDSVYLLEGGERDDEFSDSAADAFASNSSSNAMIDNDASWGAVSELTLMDSDISKSNFLSDLEEGYHGSDFDSAAVVFASNSSSNGMNDSDASWGAVSELTPMDSDISKSNFLADLDEGDYEKSDFDGLKHIFDGFVQEDNFDDSGSSFRLDPSFGLFEESSDWDEFVKSM